MCASVDPTQIGLMRDAETCTANARRLAQAVLESAPAPRPGHDALMIDMEDAGVTQASGWPADAYEFEMLYGVRPNWSESWCPGGTGFGSICPSAATGSPTRSGGWASRHAICASPPAR